MQLVRNLQYLLFILASQALGQSQESFDSLDWMNRYDRLFYENFPEFRNLDDTGSVAILEKLQGLLEKDELTSEQIYLIKRQMIGFDYKLSREICTSLNPKADDLIFKALCIREDESLEYRELKPKISELLEQAKELTASTNLFSKVAEYLSPIVSMNNDTFWAISILEDALSSLPKKDSYAYHSLKYQLAYLYTPSSNKRTTVETGISYMKENENFYRQNQMFEDADFSLYDIGIAYLFSLESYSEASEAFEKITHPTIYGLNMDKEVFLALSYALDGQLTKAKRQYEKIDLNNYEDPNRLSFLKCYKEIIAYKTGLSTSLLSCRQLSMETPNDVILHLAKLFSEQNFPSEAKADVLSLNYQYYKNKIAPAYQDSFETRVKDLELANAKNEAMVQKMIAKGQKLKSEAEQQRMLLLFGMALIVSLTIIFSYIIIMMRRHQEALKQSESARTLFFHNTSHELRTPLNGIIGYLELIKMEHYGPLNDKIKTQLAKSLNLVESLKIQVNTILDLAKTKKGELKLNNKRHSLKEITQDISNLAEALNTKLGDQSCHIDLIADHDSFVCDKEKILTILRNLVGNAFKFKDPDRDNIVSVVLERKDDQLSITVKDTGIGIDKTHYDLIFEEFKQLEASSNRRYEGSGLGLNMVKNLVQLMGGSVELSSKPGFGSVFWVKIPEATRIDTLEPEQKIANKMKLETNFSSLPVANMPPIEILALDSDWKLLVIDDNQTNCEIFKEILSVDGYDVQYSLNGEQALKQMQKSRPDLVLLDLMMPGLSGEDVIREMKNNSALKSIPVVLITARASEEDRLFGLSLGADDYLPKPVISIELRLRVRNILERERLFNEVLEGYDKLSDEKRKSEALNKSLVIADRQLIQAEKMVLFGQLVASVMHDIASPAQYIGFAVASAREFLLTLTEGLMLIEQQLPSQDAFEKIGEEIAEIEDALHNIEFGNNRIASIQKALMKQSRLSEELEVVNFKEIIEESLLILGAKIRLYSIDLRVDPDFNDMLRRTEVAQVITNLVSNASDALSEKRSRTNEYDIIIELKQVDGGYILKIEDDGKGIPIKERSQVFEAFYTTKPVGQGTGLGLMICKKIIEGLGGRIRAVPPEVLSGACFEIVFVKKNAKQSA